VRVWAVAVAVAAVAVVAAAVAVSVAAIAVGVVSVTAGVVVPVETATGEGEGVDDGDAVAEGVRAAVTLATWVPLGAGVSGNSSRSRMISSTIAVLTGWKTVKSHSL